jgi:glutaconate CoA-transferase subunit B
MMIVAAARALTGHRTCLVGIGLPNLAANLAMRLGAPELVLLYESGAIGARPDRLPASIGDGVLADSATAVVSVPELFNYWLQPGRVDVGFLGAAEIDRFGNLNTTVIGDYRHPAVRLPGAGGAPEIAAACGEVIVVLRHARRAFVDRVGFVTTVGHGDGPGCREHLGLRGRGPSRVITDLGELRPDPQTRELSLAAVHAGVTPADVIERTGWPLRVCPDLTTTAPPTGGELTALRALRASSPGRVTRHAATG